MRITVALTFLGAELSWSHLWIFLIGLGVGAVLITLVYALMITLSLRPPKIKVDFDEKKFSAEALNDLVSEKHEKFKALAKKKEALAQFGVCKDVVGETMTEIASKFYPKSKYPMLELNVSEVLVLNRQITARLEGLFNKPVVSWFRKLKVSQVVGIYDLKKKFDENEPLHKILDFTKEAGTLIKLFRWKNPTTWLGFGVGKAFSFVCSKICIAAISFTAEESYKVYSKKFMIEDVKVDTGADKLLDEAELPALEEGDTAKV